MNRNHVIRAVAILLGLTLFGFSIGSGEFPLILVGAFVAVLAAACALNGDFDC